jgi:Zn-dependent protease
VTKKLHPVSLENMKHLVVFISLDMNILLAFLFHSNGDLVSRKAEKSRGRRFL